MRRTLLLCFIHGFKGGADTFGTGSQFSQDLRRRVAEALSPHVDVRVAIYPPYETRGDLAACVSRFIEWLQEKVIDLEVAAGTASPTVDPSVHCILIGHSMGGIVAADTLLALAGEQRIGEGSAEGVGDEGKVAGGGGPELNPFMFPYVQAVLGFDTPYLGIAPGVVAHGAEGQYAAASAALAQVSSLTETLRRVGGGSGGTGAGGGGGWGSGSGSSSGKSKGKTAQANTTATTIPASAWGWGKIALAASAGALAAGAAAAGVTAAYRRRDQLSEGWNWARSHLAFIGCLARGEELRRRLARIDAVHRQLGVGFGNVYTRLGKAASSRQTTATTSAGHEAVNLLLPSERTFCNLPNRGSATKTPAGEWREAINDAATDETGAHISMFEPAVNPNYNMLLSDAQEMIVRWTRDSEWYRSAAA